MIKTKSKLLVEKAREFYRLSREIKELSRKHEALRDYFKEIMDKNEKLLAGDIEIEVDERLKVNLDASAITDDMGPEFISRYQWTTAYKVVTVKKV